MVRRLVLTALLAIMITGLLAGCGGKEEEAEQKWGFLPVEKMEIKVNEEFTITKGFDMHSGFIWREKYDESMLELLENIIDFGEDKKPLNSIIVHKKSLDEALNFMNKVGKSADTSYDKIEEEATSKRLRTTSTRDARDRILSFIASRMPDGVSRMEITLKFKNSMKSSEISELMEEISTKRRAITWNIL